MLTITEIAFFLDFFSSGIKYNYKFWDSSLLSYLWNSISTMTLLLSKQGDCLASFQKISNIDNFIKFVLHYLNSFNDVVFNWSVLYQELISPLTRKAISDLWDCIVPVCVLKFIPLYIQNRNKCELSFQANPQRHIHNLMLLASAINYTNFKFWGLGARQYERVEEENSFFSASYWCVNSRKALAFPELLAILNLKILYSKKSLVECNQCSLDI